MIVALVLCGPSQAGKSTLANLLAGKHVAPVGRGDGTSVTSQAHTYQTKIGLVQEIPGYNDSRLRVNNDKTAMQGAAQLASHQVEKVRFGVVESLSGDTTQLRSTVGELIRQYGERVRGSIFVVATKRDRAYDDELQPRLAAIKEIMNDLGIGDNLVTWQSRSRAAGGEGIAGQALEEQLASLNKALGATKPVATKELQQLTDRIQARAQQLCNAQVPERWTETVRVQENYVEEVSYREPYEVTSYKPCERSGLDRPVWTGDPHLLTFGPATAVPELLTFGPATAVPELRDDTAWEKVTETKYYDATRYENRSRWVSKDVPMERRKELKDFFPQARKEILDEIRSNVAA